HGRLVGEAVLLDALLLRLDRRHLLRLRGARIFLADSRQLLGLGLLVGALLLAARGLLLLLAALLGAGRGLFFARLLAARALAGGSRGLVDLALLRVLLGLRLDLLGRRELLGPLRHDVPLLGRLRLGELLLDRLRRRRVRLRLVDRHALAGV